MKTKQPCIYRPDINTCKACAHKNRDCSGLQFKEMPVVRQYSSAGDDLVIKIVKCFGYERGIK